LYIEEKHGIGTHNKAVDPQKASHVIE